MTLPRITFGIIVLNGEPFIRYNLRALYPYAHQLIVVEGACPAARKVATSDGHSRDSTLETMRRFKEEEDPEGKVIVVTAEDEGGVDGFWPEKDAMSQAYARRATGNYLWQVDSDEFYRQQDLSAVAEMLSLDGGIREVSFRVKTFWGGLDYRTDGYYLRKGAQDFHRLFAWGEGYSYAAHRPPTVVDERGVDLRTGRVVTAKELASRGIYMYHYELLLPKQVREKCSYYADVMWSDQFRSLDRWMMDSYMTLKDPFRVHMVYQERSWLKRFRGEHPEQVCRMIEDIGSGMFPGIDLRNNDDIEVLLKNWRYISQREILRTMVPMKQTWSWAIASARSSLRGTVLGEFMKRLRDRIRGDMVPIASNSRKIAALAEGWRDARIPVEQRKLNDVELQGMYRGAVSLQWQILADAVRFTGSEQGEIVEVGCATGYIYEVLRHLLGHTINYLGIDYSDSMLEEARRLYPDVLFKSGDATALPIADESCDILLSGNVLIHVPDYRTAIRESARVSKKWVIFHRTPVTEAGTSFFSKKAYGVPCVEVHFNEEEFLELTMASGMELRRVYRIDQDHKTFIFEKSADLDS